MNPQSDHQHEIRKVVLPSGRTIEVIYFSDTTTVTPEAPRQDLHVCPECGCELVHPIAWEEGDEVHWQIDLRCPNCEWAGDGTWHQDAVEGFDEILDRGTQTLVRDLRHLAHANMEEEIERFSAALRADALLPEDF